MTCSVLSACLIAVLFSVAYSAPADEHEPFDCPQNEYYVKCSPIICQKLCRELYVPFPCPGTASNCFQPACVCNEGYLRNSEGTCVPVEKCEKKCEENEEFHSCIYSVCRPQYCYDRTARCDPVDKEYCMEGCVCKENFLRDGAKCVPKDQCSV